MIDIWLLLFIVIVGTVVAIEGIPDGFKKKAKAVVAELAAAARIITESIVSMIMVVVKRIGQRIRQSRSSSDQSNKLARPSPSIRVVIGTAVAVVFSPVAAIPSTFLFALLLYVLNMIGGDEYDFVTNGAGTLRYILGYAFVILIATLDVISRWFAIALPFFIGLGFIAANYASRSKRFARKLALSTLMVGGAYPLIFMLSAALDVFNEPIFN